MKTLSIDIETYSDIPLQKTGVYRYVESPDFEILLFAYSVDSQPVQVIDLACGEKIPKEILLALEDENVIKWAFNATFERICLSRFLGYPTGEYLNPESWRCSMIWSATMGLPLSLEGVGAVLGLEKQKLSEGKDLIKYFCQPCAPTKANGQRTRNRLFHAPDKWAMFKKYNIRDVETEMGIQQRLAKFPVPAQVWEEYHLDQEINDRGVRLDMDLVAAAIEMDTRSRKELTDTMKEITELENPNSVQQMKAWLSANGLETDTLSKKAITDLLKTAPPKLAQVLTLRQQLAKSSVRKYQAMEKQYALMVVPVACSNFMEPTALEDFPVVIFNCKIYHKTTCQILQKHAHWYALVILKPLNSSTKMCRIHSHSLSAPLSSQEKVHNSWWLTFLLLKLVSSHGLPVKNGVKMSSPKVATSTVPLQVKCLRFPLKNTVSMVTSVKKVKLQNLPLDTVVL